MKQNYIYRKLKVFLFLSGIFFLGNHADILAQTVTRGPYLQISTPTSIQIRWRTDVATSSKVQYGLRADALSASNTDNQLVTEHIITISNLASNTKYYYSIGAMDKVLQGTSDNFFITAPKAGTEQKVRIWAVGDCGNRSERQKNVKEAYLKYIGAEYTNLWLLMGDNVYFGGDDNDFQKSFFEQYQNDKIMKQTVLFPAPGNHDYDFFEKKQGNPDMAYYQVFSMPVKGESGGVPSGSKAFYSYDFANIHFISLDSYAADAQQFHIWDLVSEQITWLKKDLEANKQKWTIVYFHHPPYTMGSHDSDNENDLKLIRQNLVPLLEKYKVDMVLCGHSHNYERSRLMKGHYGLEASFKPELYNKSSSSGKYDNSDNSCPFFKNSNSAENEGIVYVVSGSAGAMGTPKPSYPHDAMYYSYPDKGGSFYIEVEANRLDAKFITEEGKINDQFTMMKDVNQKKNISIDHFQTLTLNASWPGGAYNWNNGGVGKSIDVTPPKKVIYTVKDGKNCLADTFNVSLNPCRIGQFVIPSSNGTTRIATYECTDEEGYVHYSDKDRNLLLSVKKGDINIGTIGDNSLTVSLSGASGAAKIEAKYPENYVKNPLGWYAMKRFWTLSSNQKLSAGQKLKVRFYYKDEDFNAIKTALNSRISQHVDLKNYFISSTANADADPSNGHLKITSDNIQLLSSTANGWLYTNLGNGTHSSEFEISQTGSGGLLGYSPARFQLQNLILKSEGEGIRIDWATSLEQNIKNFSLEMKSGSNNFQSVYTINSKAQNGYSESTLNYSFLDKPRFGSDIQYRLKITDLDENISYSAISTISNQALGLEELLNSENPFQFESLSVYDLQGREFLKIESKGVLSRSLFDKIPSGLYLVELRTERDSKILKLVK